MKLFSASKTREADNYTIKHEPISSVDLMERAASIATNKLLDLYPNVNLFHVFLGPGNNGGDGLVIARLITELKKDAIVYFLKVTDKVSNDFKVNFNRLKKQGKANIIEINSIDKFPNIKNKDVIIDAIFGSGLTRVLKGFPEDIVKKINNSKTEIVSIDCPSGLFGEENHKKLQTIIKATHTFSFQYPSLSFMFPENEEFVGHFHIIDIGIHEDYIKKTETPYYYINKQDIKLKKRTKFSHKGTYGHSLIIAGSYGKAGASVLTVKAAQKAGAGLVTALVPKCNYQILQISSPETMLQIDNSEKFIKNLTKLDKFNAVAIGPGIGFEDGTKQMLKILISKYKKPIVFDADAITILSENKDWLKNISKNSIITPHPKEFERLVGKSRNNYERLQMQINFAINYKILVILKGAHTSIATPMGKVYFNSTGNPGMATGGSGDVLTGIIASFLAQNYSAEQAALTGVYIHGLAGDIAKKNTGQYSLIASDIIKYLPNAIMNLEL